MQTGIGCVYTGFVDPNNPVVKLCIRGLKAENRGDIESANHSFALAWDARESDLDSCIAAHYFARHQPKPELALFWNQEALNFARKVNDTRVDSFFPSLYINLARSYEQVGDKAEANKYFTLAATDINDTAVGSYGLMLRESIKAGQNRTGS